MPFCVAIIGRPNVGKSTLFNRLVGRRTALVDDTPGLTRDWRSGEGQVGDIRFTVIDTAGLEESAPKSLEARMRRQTELAVQKADVVLFVVDARAGLTSLDQHFGKWLRKLGAKIVLVAGNRGSAPAGFRRARRHFRGARGGFCRSVDRPERACAGGCDDRG
jgi:GTP-binding protein